MLAIMPRGGIMARGEFFVSTTESLIDQAAPKPRRLRVAANEKRDSIPGASNLEIMFFSICV